MKFKNISKLLTIGILLNSTPFNSFAGVLSPDTRYETFTDSYITVNDILEEDKVGVEIEGNTLVNLFDINNYNTYMYPNKMTLTGSKLRVNYEPSDAIGNISPIGTNKTNILKNNTTYTMIVNIEGQATGSIFGKPIPADARGINKFVFTYDELAKVDCYRLWLGSNTETIDFSIEFLMLLEGDWTNKELPDYFEGMKSSFEDQLVTQEMIDNGQEKAENLGKYKVEYKTTGKNLFDGKTLNDEWISIADNNIIPTSEGNKSTGWIKCKPNTSYTVQGGDRNRWALRNSKGEITVVGGVVGDETPTMTTLSDTVEFKCYVKWTDASSSISLESLLRNLQIEESSFMTDYEPYKESVNTFYLNSPLLEGDTIEYINGQAYHVRRSGSVIADGSIDEWWYLNNPLVTGQGYQFVSTGGRTLSSSSDIVICDKIPSYGGYDNESYSNNIWVHKNDTLVIHHPTISTNEEFNLWLKNNPITVVYKLKSPIYEPIKADLSVQLFEGTTHITNNSNIPANMEVTVDRVLNRAVEATELAKTNPTVENLSRARMWVNLVSESVKKDELQSEINSITDIDNLQLERKSVSANMDVYVKSENMLSMSLNTNSITFDGYSGVEDMEKLGAVNISINSSLPYDLNAYLPGEIANADKSEIMDIEMLKIKESSNVDYQNFVNTTDKIVLKGGCNAGNNLIHNIDLKLASNQAHKADVYKTVIKFEAEQK